MTHPAPAPGFDEADLYRSLFQSAGVGIAIADLPNGTLLHANPKLSELLGYTAAELVGMSFQELTCADDRDRNQVEVERLVRGEISAFRIQERYQRRDGSRFWAQVDATLLGGQSSCAVAIVQDITPEKAAEQALQKSHERYRLMVENIDAVFWLASPGAEEILYVSPAYERIWGRSCTSLYRDPLSFVEAVHPDDRAQADAMDLHSRERWQVEYRIIRPDGSHRWICDRGYTIRDHAGESKGLTGVAIDITDRKSDELQLSETVRALHQNTKDLERVNRDLQQFASVVSHDLKAPLRAISGRVGMLSEDLGGNVASEVQEHLSTLQNRVKAMEGIITGLLQYSRSVQKSNPRNVSVRDLVLQQLDSMDIPDGFTIEVGAELPPVTADPLQLGQIFTNLIDNGIRHHDRPSGHISVHGRKNGTHHEFFIADDGPGIPEEERQRVFEMFESGRHHGAGSTGIGLALVRKLVEENGGAIYLDSGSRGSTFTFTWPLR